MLIPSLSDLAASDEGAAFLALAWNELFHSTTPDTFQPRLCHTASLVSELADVAKLARNSPKWSNHLVQIKNELDQVLNLDPLFQTKRQLKGILKTLASLQSPTEIEALSLAALEKLSDYKAWAIERFRDTAGKLPTEKRSALNALSLLATCAIRTDRSPRDFNEMFADNPLPESVNQFTESIVDLFKQTKAVYTCFLPVSGNIAYLQQIARKCGFRPASRIAILKLDEEYGQGFPQAEFVSIAMDAYGPGDAVKSAVRKLRPALDVFNFYQNRESLTILDQALVHALSDQVFKIEIGGQLLRRLRPRRDASRYTHNVLDEISTDRLHGRLLNALELHSIAHASAASRVKLVNLWSALECLAEVESDENALTAVTDFVAPIVTWRRVEKMLTYCAMSIYRFISSPGHQTPIDLGCGFNPQPNHVSSEELFISLTVKKHDPKIVELLTAVSPHPLLRYRVFDLWERLHQPREFARELKASLQRVKWQLCRLYRARNLIVHVGEEPLIAPYLLDNLQYYFTTCLARILHGMVENPGWGHSAASGYFCAHAKHTMKMFEEDPFNLTIGHFFAKTFMKNPQTIWTPNLPLLDKERPPDQGF